MNNLKCLACIGEGKLIVQETNGNGTAQPLAKDAVTLAPSWQQTQVGGQTMLACVAVPTCADHLQVERKSQLDLAQGIVLDRRTG